ncbi:MAG: hypothetical protein ACE361_02850 [Aureliella sp.]
MPLLLVKRLAIAYGLLMTLAGGGLAFANIFGFVATAISFGGESAPVTTPVRTSMNIGWIFGVGVALLGTLLNYRRQRKRQAETQADDKKIIQPAPEPTESPKRASSESRRYGILASAAWGGFFGTLLGALLGASFVLLWFSMTYSPFAPQAWATSVSSERTRVGTSARDVFIAETDHPVALYAFGFPVALGALGGAVFGGIVRVSDGD